MGLLDACVFAQAVVVEPFMVMDGVFLRILHRRCLQHGVDLRLNLADVEGCIDPDTMQGTRVVRGKVGDVDIEFVAREPLPTRATKAVVKKSIKIAEAPPSEAAGWKPSIFLEFEGARTPPAFAKGIVTGWPGHQARCA